MKRLSSVRVVTGAAVAGQPRARRRRSPRPTPPAAPAASAPAGCAGPRDGCQGLPSHAALKAALVAATQAETSGLNNHMWATIVNRDGVVCAVAFSGANRGAQWPGSRVISAQKANTANAFSLDATSSSDGSGQAKGLALSTANLYSAVQPGGSLYGLQHSNPVDTDAAYAPAAPRSTAPPAIRWSTATIGGVNVFGGGLGLYAAAAASSAASASAATRRAPTTTSPGACATS